MIGGFRDFFAVDIINGHIVYGKYFRAVQKHESIGHGRFIHRKIWDQMQGRLWKDSQNTGLDGYSERKIISFTKQNPWLFTKSSLMATLSSSINCAPLNCMPLVVMKSSSNINSFNVYMRAQTLDACLLVEDGKSRSSQQFQRFLDIAVGNVMSNMLVSLRLLLEHSKEDVHTALVSSMPLADDILRLKHNWTVDNISPYFGEQMKVLVGGLGYRKGNAKKGKHVAVYDAEDIASFLKERLIEKKNTLLKRLPSLGSTSTTDFGLRINNLVFMNKEILVEFKLHPDDIKFIRRLVRKNFVKKMCYY